MSTNISNFQFLTYVRGIVGDTLDKREADQLGLDTENVNLEEADLDINELINNEDLYEQFAVLYTKEQEKNQLTDKEKEKEERNKVQDKNGAGI